MVAFGFIGIIAFGMGHVNASVPGWKVSASTKLFPLSRSVLTTVAVVDFHHEWYVSRDKQPGSDTD